MVKFIQGLTKLKRENFHLYTYINMYNYMFAGHKLSRARIM